MLILGFHGGSKFENEIEPVGFDRHDGAALLNIKLWGWRPCGMKLCGVLIEVQISMV
jgi:hypothetical protein